jgi:hypothetical protein
MENDDAIRAKEVDGIHLRTFEDSHGRFATTLTEPETLSSNALYDHGYDKDEALRVFDECLERFDLSEIDDVTDVSWER